MIYSLSVLEPTGCSLLDGADEEVDNGGDVLTSLEEELAREVRLELFDVGSDLLFMGEVVLGDVRDELALVGEDSGPLLDRTEVILHALASVELLGHLEGQSDDLKHTLSDVVPAAGFEVADSGHELVLNLRATSVASLKLGQVVLLGHAVEEASEDMVHLVGGASVGGSQVHEAFRDVAEEGRAEVSSSHTRVEVVAAGPVALRGLQVSLQGVLAAEVVEGDGLAELLRVCEDQSPIGDSLEIGLNLGAGSEIFLQVEDELLQVEDSFEDVHVLEIARERFNVLKEIRRALHAGLDSLELQVTGQTIDEASDEVGDSQDVFDGRESLRLLDGADGLSQSHGGINTSLEVGSIGPVLLLLSKIFLDGASVE
mmetsp:Transcript_30625/g.37834  ORF Transcript_30625/g.37834 Transcript_30625/m.37834 type:complete len:371 (+) Transcript_30625:142-1254(+)